MAAEPKSTAEASGNIRCSSYTFPAGIPAFEKHTRFRLLENPIYAPIVVLQSELDPAVRFACAPVSLLVRDYQLELGEEDCELLGCDASQPGLLVFAILTFRQGSPPTANLMAPVVLNPARGLGVQSIQWNAAYSHTHPVREERPCL